MKIWIDNSLIISDPQMKKFIEEIMKIEEFYALLEEAAYWG